MRGCFSGISNGMSNLSPKAENSFPWINMDKTYY